MEKNKEEYIGDGIYVTFDGQQIKMWTSDGEHRSDVIYIDEYSAEELVAFFIKCFGK